MFFSQKKKKDKNNREEITKNTNSISQKDITNHPTTKI